MKKIIFYMIQCITVKCVLFFPLKSKKITTDYEINIYKGGEWFPYVPLIGLCFLLTEDYYVLVADVNNSTTIKIEGFDLIDDVGIDNVNVKRNYNFTVIELGVEHEYKAMFANLK